MKYRLYFSGFLNGKLLIHKGEWTTYAHAADDRIKWTPIISQLNDSFDYIEFFKEGEE